MMKAYHMSETAKAGDVLETDHQQLILLAQPFVKALERSTDLFYGMVLNAEYTYAVLSKFGLHEWSDYAKWATEGVFEYIRKKEFPAAVSRLKCNYFYDNLNNVKRLYNYDWGDEPEEVQNKIHLFEVELDDGAIKKYDMNFFDKAYTEMEKNQDLDFVFDCARKYFSQERTSAPVLEIMTDRDIKILKDITDVLRQS